MCVYIYTHQSAGEAHHRYRSLSGLRNIQQVIKEGLVLMMCKQIKLLQNEEHRLTAAFIAYANTDRGESRYHVQ